MFIPGLFVVFCSFILVFLFLLLVFSPMFVLLICVSAWVCLSCVSKSSLMPISIPIIIFVTCDRSLIASRTSLPAYRTILLYPSSHFSSSSFFVSSVCLSFVIYVCALTLLLLLSFTGRVSSFLLAPSPFSFCFFVVVAPFVPSRCLPGDLYT